MRQYLTKGPYNSVMDAIEKGSKIDRNLADHISTGLKEWAISKGATHYTLVLTFNRFYRRNTMPFLSQPNGCDRKIGGSALVQQEPDVLVSLTVELEILLKQEVI